MTNRIFASSLLILFSSKSRARAFLRSAMNWTRPRMLELPVVDRPRKPAAAEEAMLPCWESSSGYSRQVYFDRFFVSCSSYSHPHFPNIRLVCQSTVPSNSVFAELSGNSDANKEPGRWSPCRQFQEARSNCGSQDRPRQSINIIERYY